MLRAPAWNSRSDRSLMPAEKPIDSRALVARAAICLIRPGMVVGFGSGSTVDQAIEAYASTLSDHPNRVVVASSRSEATCRRFGIRTVSPDDVESIDLLLDGADELNEELILIKGGGAALVRERLLAEMSNRFVVIADAAKRVRSLGAFPLPVAILPFASRSTLSRLQKVSPQAAIRRDASGAVLSDDGLFIVDLPLQKIEEPRRLAAMLKAMPGVVESGLFIDLAGEAWLGDDAGRITKLVSKQPDPPGS